MAPTKPSAGCKGAQAFVDRWSCERKESCASEYAATPSIDDVTGQIARCERTSYNSENRREGKMIGELRGGKLLLRFCHASAAREGDSRNPTALSWVFFCQKPAFPQNFASLRSNRLRWVAGEIAGVVDRCLRQNALDTRRPRGVTWKPGGYEKWARSRYARAGRRPTPASRSSRPDRFPRESTSPAGEELEAEHGRLQLQTIDRRETQAVNRYPTSRPVESTFRLVVSFAVTAYPAS